MLWYLILLKNVPIMLRSYKMSLDRGQITDKIIGIINEVRHSSESISEKDYDIPLLGDHFGMDYQDLVFIFLELMEEFKIRFTWEDVKDYGFNSINGIADSIERRTANHTA